MTNEEIGELLTKGKQDGAVLYRVADAVYRVAIALNWIVAIIGILLTIAIGGSMGFAAALGVAFLTLIVCAAGYAGAVLGSHGAKVLVHLLFSNLAILEKEAA